MAIKFPNEPIGKRHIDEMRSRSNINELIPYFRMIEDGVGECRAAFVDTTDQKVSAYYFTADRAGWVKAGSFSRENEPISQWFDRFSGEILYTGDDSPKAEDLYLKLANRANGAHEKPVISGPGVSSPDDVFPVGFDECDHATETRLVASHLDRPMEICSNCGMPISLQTGKRSIPVKKLLKSEIITQDSNMEINKGGKSTIGVIHENSAGLGNILADVFSFIGKIELHFSTNYEPDLYSASFLIEDGAVKGIAIWNQRNGNAMLRQLIILPEYRGEGASLRLLNAWHEVVCDGGQYLADAPNEAGRKMLESAGHLDKNQNYGPYTTLAYSYSPDSVFV